MESRTNSERVPNKGSHDVNTKSIDLMTKQYLHFDPRLSFASVWTPPRVLALLSHTASRDWLCTVKIQSFPFLSRLESTG